MLHLPHGELLSMDGRNFHRVLQYISSLLLATNGDAIHGWPGSPWISALSIGCANNPHFLTLVVALAILRDGLIGKDCQQDDIIDVLQVVFYSFSSFSISRPLLIPNKSIANLLSSNGLSTVIFFHYSRCLNLSATVTQLAQKI